MKEVGGISEKIDLLKRFTPARVFLHPSNMGEASGLASGGLDVRECPLPPAGIESTALQQIRPLLDALGVRPTAPHSSLDDCIDAFNASRTWPDEARRREYYDQNIRERLGERMRDASGIEPGKDFLLVYNPTNEPTCRLMLDLARPSRLLVLRQTSGDSTKDQGEYARAKALAAASGVSESNMRIETLSPSSTEDELRSKMNELQSSIGCGYADGMNGTSFLKSFAVVLASRSGLVPIALEQGWDRAGIQIGKYPVIQRFGFVNGSP